MFPSLKTHRETQLRSSALDSEDTSEDKRELPVYSGIMALKSGEAIILSRNSHNNGSVTMLERACIVRGDGFLLAAG